MQLDAKDLEIKKDGRGIVLKLMDKKSIKAEIKEILLITAKPGTIRGGHYHASKTEWLCVIRGKARFILEDIKTAEKKEFVLSADKPAMVRIPNHAVHSIQNIGKDELYLIELSDQIYEENPDTFKK